MREWTGALSGWAAAIAAGVTVYYLRRQIVEMKLQVHAMDRQTEFAVGDARPSLSIADSPDGNRVAIRLTNWNRRPIVVTKIEAEAPDDVFEITVRTPQLASGQTPYHEKGYTKAELTKHRTTVEGWEDRSAPPPHRVFELILARGEAVKELDDFRRAAGVRFHVTILGDEHTALTLRAIHPQAFVWMFPDSHQVSKSE